MPRRDVSFASAVSASSVISAPVGLHGELRTMPFVRGVMASRKSCAVSAKPSSARARTTTGSASANFTCSTSVGQPGACVMTSSPASNSVSAVL